MSSHWWTIISDQPELRLELMARKLAWLDTDLAAPSATKFTGEGYLTEHGGKPIQVIKKYFITLVCWI